MLKNKIVCSAAFSLALAWFSVGVRADIDLPYLFSDGAVLQRGEAITIWGRAAANSQVSVRFAGETKNVSSDGKGLWSAEFKKHKAGGPFSLIVKSGNESRTVNDIVIGDVWVASGQSNMEFELYKADGADAEIASANNSQVREFKVPRSWAAVASDQLAGGEWHRAVAANVGNFSAVAYFFAKKLNAETHIPIGIIHSSWGGSNIESWMSPEALGKTAEETSAYVERLTAEGEAKTQAVKNKLQRWPGSVIASIDAVNADADWSGADVDESDWLAIDAPSLWENQGLAGVDGVVWYRKTFQLTKAEAQHPIELGLARIDDEDITWVNGNKVGDTHVYDAVRKYQVPVNVLHAGSNTIAVRVLDTGGGGGIYSDAALLYLQTQSGRRSLAGQWKVKADKVSVSGLDNINHVDTALYNKMMHPLFNFPVKGVIWYQGESNADNADQARHYRQQFPAMISDWRQRWQRPALPFYWVQLANFNSHNDTNEASPWAILRDAQSATLALPNTGEAIIIDVGNPNDIHPRDKSTVGDRLARIALNKTYGVHKVHYLGPIFTSATLADDDLVLTFGEARRLGTDDNSTEVKGFEVAGRDGQYHSVKGEIKNNKVVLQLDGIDKPTALRYAWSDNPEEANLTGDDALPAGPFMAKISL